MRNHLMRLLRALVWTCLSVKSISRFDIYSDPWKTSNEMEVEIAPMTMRHCGKL